MFPKNAHHYRIPPKKEFFRSQEEMFNNRLTSVTPGRPDNRALGVQLPHSLSDPRTSPLRTSRRGGEYVQFDSEPGQLPFRRTINPLDSLRSNETFFTNLPVYLLCIQLDRWTNHLSPTRPPKPRYNIPNHLLNVRSWSRANARLASKRSWEQRSLSRPGGESAKKDDREGVYFFVFFLFSFLFLYRRVTRPVAGSKRRITISTDKTRVSIIKHGRGFVIEECEIITLKKKKKEEA